MTDSNSSRKPGRARASLSARGAVRTIVVSGDALADWVVAQQDEGEPRRTAGPKWQGRQQGVRQLEIPGGSRLLEKLITTALPKAQAWTPTWDHVDWFDTQISHYHATLAPFPEGDKVKDYDDLRNFRWRISDDLGISRRSKCKNHNEKCLGVAEPENADLVVIADAGLGFFNDHELPKAINDSEKAPWVIVKTGGDGMLARTRTDRLWEALHSRRDRVIVVTTADDLRRVSGLEIRRGTAWERAAGDCLKIFQQEHRLNQYRFVAVSFGPAGAFLFDRDMHDGHNYWIFYNPVSVEGSPDFWLNGRMWGYTSTLATAIAQSIISSIDSKGDPQNDSVSANATITSGVKRGLKAMQEVYKNGFGRIVAEGDSDQSTPIPDFPFAAIKSALKLSNREIAKDKNIAWVSVTERNIKSPVIFTSGRDLEEIARGIVYGGVDEVLATTSIPHLKYGKVVTVDRREIESCQSVRALVKEYAERSGTRVRRYWKTERARTPTPLSIAVFGQPGSGKSTAVREVIGSIKVQEREFTFEEFNLSQFRDTSELANSFHLLRDDRLRGKVPVVLWDEFDSFLDRPLGWLRYFLSPMQDGTFQDGQIVHPIGRSVFVFAGGVYSSLQSFKSQESDAEFKAAKGPDFLSRVRGTMDLQGIEKRPDDPFWVIRRAILLRSVLETETSLFPKGQDGDKGFDGRDGNKPIDEDVLNAFLRVSEFTHGVRSMQAIVRNSSLLGERYFSRSSLPNVTQLNLHVSSKEFYEAMDSASARRTGGSSASSP
ncbi:AAA family ATPase [Streptomyces lydicus]|uniref:AAA family ATPase n=1 Tax=Streptomyces lydicus TaxID=47763 RepID=UPI0028704F49|nr:AAA family ATPase [Streptomyces lydicus]